MDNASRSDRAAAPKNVTTVELEGDRTIVISRTFNGPAHIVFEAWTRPEHVKRWWAPRSRGVELIGCTADVRPGGGYRYVLRLPDGMEIGFTGRYLEVTPPTRLVQTQLFEPMADAGEAHITATFEERDGRTHLVSREVYPSAEARAAALASGMEDGMRETIDQLDALIPTLL